MHISIYFVAIYSSEKINHEVGLPAGAISTNILFISLIANGIVLPVHSVSTYAPN
jgi:hypothetical protein